MPNELGGAVPEATDISRADASRLHELAGLLANLDVPAHGAAVVRMFGELVEAEIIGRWHFDREGEHTVLTQIASNGALPSGYFRELVRGIASGELAFLFSTRIPERAQRNRPVVVPGVRKTVETHERLRRLGVRRGDASMRRLVDLHDRYGIADHVQLRMVICDGPLALDYINATQAASFSRRQRRLFTAAARLFRRRSLIDRMLADAGTSRLCFEAAIGAIGRPAFLVDSAGVVVYCNALGEATIEGGETARLDIVAALDGDRRAYQVTPISIRGVPRFALVIGRRASLGERAHALADEFALSSRARQVLVLAADGYSTKNIASRIGIADNTVEYHLTRIFALLRINGRSELQRALIDRY